MLKLWEKSGCLLGDTSVTVDEVQDLFYHEALCETIECISECLWKMLERVDHFAGKTYREIVQHLWIVFFVGIKFKMLNKLTQSCILSHDEALTTERVWIFLEKNQRLQTTECGWMFLENTTVKGLKRANSQRLTTESGWIFLRIQQWKVQKERVKMFFFR